MDRFKAEEESIFYVLSGKGRNFNIPMYQRPYSWELVYCQKLWDDIKTFYFIEKPHTRMSDISCRYFLGPIVLYEDKTTHKMEIIDGQQRITTLLLLLKNFYDKINATTNRKDPDQKTASDALDNLEKCLWKWRYSEEKEMDCVDINSPILSSEVTDDKTYDLFKKLMTSCYKFEITKKSTTYEKNYNLFSQLIDSEFSEGGELAKVPKERFVNIILNKCSVLFIDCSDQSAALKIFDTLNNRGMQLRDADILKAQMFKPLSDENQKQEFRKTWDTFSKLAKGFTLAKQTSQYDPLTDVFRQLMGVRRAELNISSNEVALRSFFEDKNAGKDLVSVEVLKNKLIPLAAFWCMITQLCTQSESSDIDEASQEELEKITWLFNEESQKYLQVLSCISINAYWRYLLSVFFVKNIGEIQMNGEKTQISHKFTELLKKVTAFSIYSLIVDTSDAYKKKVYKKACLLWQSGVLPLDEQISLNDFSSKMDARECSRELSRAVILLHAYLNKNQVNLIPVSAQIEHIFPRSWAKDMTGVQRIKGVDEFTDEDMKAKLYETFGNKVMLEAIVNNAARDKYYDFKTAIYHGLIPPTYKGTIYRDEEGKFNGILLKNGENEKCRPASKIADIHDIWNKSKWGKMEIEMREKTFRERIWNFLQSNYQISNEQQ